MSNEVKAGFVTAGVVGTGVAIVAYPPLSLILAAAIFAWAVYEMALMALD